MWRHRCCGPCGWLRVLVGLLLRRGCRSYLPVRLLRVAGCLLMLVSSPLLMLILVVVLLLLVGSVVRLLLLSLLLIVRSPCSWIPIASGCLSARFC